jgi:hypothetical protein
MICPARSPPPATRSYLRAITFAPVSLRRFARRARAFDYNYLLVHDPTMNNKPQTRRRAICFMVPFVYWFYLSITVILFVEPFYSPNTATAFALAH